MDMDQEKYERAKKQVEEIKGFYIHLMTYLIVIFFLFLLNVFSNSHTYWFQWPALGWGIGVLFHANSVFFFKGLFGKAWEERKIKEIMEKDN